MQRIQPIATDEASPQTAELLAAVRKQLGGVPNILATLARSSAALGGYLGFAGALAKGTLSAKRREQIALAVAGANRCDYCASAHAGVGAQHGLTAEEIARNLDGRSDDERADAVLHLVGRIVATQGRLSDDDLSTARRAGIGDEEIVEIVANTVLNIFTNYFNHVAATEIDFPLVTTAQAAAA